MSSGQEISTQSRLINQIRRNVSRKSWGNFILSVLQRSPEFSFFFVNLWNMDRNTRKKYWVSWTDILWTLYSTVVILQYLKQISIFISRKLTYKHKCQISCLVKVTWMKPMFWISPSTVRKFWIQLTAYSRKASIVPQYLMETWVLGNLVSLFLARK